MSPLRLHVTPLLTSLPRQLRCIRLALHLHTVVLQRDLLLLQFYVLFETTRCRCPSCEASWITANDIIALYGIFFPLPFCLSLRLNHCWKSGRREKEEETSLPRQARWPKEFRCRRMASIKRFHLSVPFVRAPLRNFRLDLRMPYTCSGISKTYFRERHTWQNVLFTLLEFINLSEMAMSLWDADLVYFKIKLFVYFYDIPIYIFCTYRYIHPYIHTTIYPYTALQ